MDTQNVIKKIKYIVFFMLIVYSVFLHVVVIEAYFVSQPRKLQIIKLYKTIEQQNDVMKGMQKEAHSKMNQLNKAIQQLDQCEKKMKDVWVQRIVKNCDDAMAFSAKEGATVYECQRVGQTTPDKVRSLMSGTP